MCIYRFVISQVFFFCMYSLPTEIKDKTQVKQFGQVPLKIDQALFLCIFQKIEIAWTILKKKYSV